LSENKNISINWKHLGEVHQSNQILPICNSFISIVGNFKQSCWKMGYIEKLL